MGAWSSTPSIPKFIFYLINYTYLLIYEFAIGKSLLHRVSAQFPLVPFIVYHIQLITLSWEKA